MLFCLKGYKLLKVTKIVAMNVFEKSLIEEGLNTFEKGCWQMNKYNFFFKKFLSSHVDVYLLSSNCRMNG